MSIFLTHVAISDFRTFGDFRLDMPAAPGLVLVTGTNGLGKSNFFDALEWGLTGAVERFRPHLKRGRRTLDEADYLTRRGANLNTHRVELTFSEGETIERGPGVTTPTSDIVRALAQPKHSGIKDLGTYLALTHFLGQAAQQRFTNRRPQDQWEVIKGPSGLERLERIRAGLRGRPVVAAFTRRLDAQRSAVTDLENRIADWNALTDRVSRLRQATNATGVLDERELAASTTELEAEFTERFGRSRYEVVGETTSLRLAALQDGVAKQMATTKARLAFLQTLDDLPAQLTQARHRASFDAMATLRMLSASGKAQAAVEAARLAHEKAIGSERDQAAAIASMDGAIALKEGTRTDLIRQAAVAELIKEAEAETDSTASAITAARAVQADADAMIARHADALAAAASRQREAGTAKARVAALNELSDLQERDGLASAALGTGRDRAEAAPGELDETSRSLADLDDAIATESAKRMEAERHAGAIEAALAQLASHLHEDDTDCPVCHSTFAPGVLKSLASSAATASDARLTMIDEGLETLRARRGELKGRIAALRLEIEAAKRRERDAEAASRSLTDARFALAQALGGDVGGDLHAAAREQDRLATQALAQAITSVDAISAPAAEANQRRLAAATVLEALTDRDPIARGRLDTLRAEWTNCAERVAARGLTDDNAEAIGASLAQARKDVEAAKRQLIVLETNKTAAAESLMQAETELAAVERTQKDDSAAREAAAAAAAELEARWTTAGLDGAPDQTMLGAAKSAQSEDVAALTGFTSRLQTLGRASENTALLAEVGQLEAAVRQAGGDEAIGEPSVHLAKLREAKAAADDALRTTEAARAAVTSYTESLKSEAETFSANVLDPLNGIIDDFNEALLSTPGESVQFRANTRVDATSVDMALRYRDEVEGALEADKDLPPQVVLSEGQLAANGFSILCAASTTYRWSKWRALLLDDPLQHNDIIHAAAFVDLMRNMVELKGYQLIMSSHDRGESEFIKRKFDAADLPCTTVLLTAPSSDGVRWDAPEYNAAARQALIHTYALVENG